MQTNFNSNIAIRFIIITTNISFVPDNIINCCEKITLKRPSKKVYNTTLNISLKNNFNSNKITNIKDLLFKNTSIPIEMLDEDDPSPYNSIMQTSHYALSSLLVNFILKYNEFNFLELREMLYDICIYDINLYSVLSYIIHQLLLKKMLTSKKLNTILIKLIDFLKLYNNNYRPIYHLERYILYIISVVHDF